MSLDWTFVHCKWSHTHTMVTKQSQSEDDCVTSWCFDSWACVCKTLQCDDRLRCLLSSFHLLPAPVSIIVRRMSGEGARERVARDETWGCVQSALHTTIWYRKYPGNMSRASISTEITSLICHKYWPVCWLWCWVQSNTMSLISQFDIIISQDYHSHYDEERGVCKTSWTGNSYHSPIPNQKISFKFLQEFGCCDLGR